MRPAPPAPRAAALTWRSGALGGGAVRPGALVRALGLALTFTLGIALGPAPGATATARAEEDEPEPPRPKKEPTAADLERRLDETKITVDWRDVAALDAINEVRQKSGIAFIFDQAFADFAATRKVTFDGYSVRAREAVQRIEKVLGFRMEADPAQGGFVLVLDPAAPTRAALAEKKLAVSWTELPVAKAIADLEKRGGVKISLHETMKGRLSRRKITWEAEAATLREAIETLYVYPPPSVAARIVEKAKLAVEIVYDGPVETKADLELYLDQRKITLAAKEPSLADALAKVATTLGAKVELDPKLAKEAKPLDLPAKASSVRGALDAIAKAAGCVWKVDGAKVRVSPGASPAGRSPPRAVY